MDIRPPRPSQRPPQPRAATSLPRPKPAANSPLKVPEELLEKGTKQPLLSTSKPSKAPRKKWLILGVAGSLLVLVVGALIAALVWYNTALQPRSGEMKRIRIVVETGATPEQVADELEQKEVIRSSLAFQILMRQTGAREKIQAGTYLFSPDQSSHDIAKWLAEGKVDNFSVTILPGQSLVKIKAQLVKDGFAASEIDTAFVKQYSHPLLADKPAGVNLDGYIYPDTYQVGSDTSVEDLLVRSFDEFYKQIEAKNLKAELAARGFNLHQGITLASIVAKETAHAEDQRQVAQVFEKRLQDGISLGSDVTFMYAAELLGQAESITIDSPYNTRVHSGLPPGAIANFNISALVAVAEPAAGDYLFFVAGDDGVTYFARTDAEHQANINRHCTQLCQ